jgi:DNA-binding response OmpR family regulator
MRELTKRPRGWVHGFLASQLMVVVLVLLTAEVPSLERLLTQAGWRTQQGDVDRATVERVGGVDTEAEGDRDPAAGAVRPRLAILLTFDSLGSAPIVERSIARYCRQGARIIVITPQATQPAVRQLLVSAMGAGADDFVTATSVDQELLLRLEALSWRRRPSREQRRSSIYGIVVDRPSRRLRYGGNQVILTPCEFRVFSLLARHASHTISRASIQHYLAPHSRSRSKNLVDVYILYLRRKLAQLHGPWAIRTVRGTGYVLVSTLTPSLPPNDLAGANNDSVKSLAS